LVLLWQAFDYDFGVLAYVLDGSSIAHCSRNVLASLLVLVLGDFGELSSMRARNLVAAHDSRDSVRALLFNSPAQGMGVTLGAYPSLRGEVDGLPTPLGVVKQLFGSQHQQLTRALSCSKQALSRTGRRPAEQSTRPRTMEHVDSTHRPAPLSAPRTQHKDQAG
jgi:hypothetical protein